MKVFFFILAFTLSIIIEATIIPLPLTLLVILLMSVFYEGETVFLVALIAGFILDGLAMRGLGSTSIFYLVFLFLVFIYESKFERKSLPFICLASCLGSWVYFLVFGSSVLWLQVGLSTIIGGTAFLAISQLQKKRSNGFLPA